MRRARSARTRADGGQVKAAVRDEQGADQQTQKLHFGLSSTEGSEQGAKLVATKSKSGLDWAPKWRSSHRACADSLHHVPEEGAGPSEQQTATPGIRERSTAALEKREKYAGGNGSKGSLAVTNPKILGSARTVRKKRTVTVKAVTPKKGLPTIGNKRKRGQAVSGLAKLAEKVRNGRPAKGADKSDVRPEDIPEPVKIPKLRVMLSQKEIREDFMKISGRRPPSKPKRHAVQIWGLALCANLDLCTSRVY